MQARKTTWLAEDTEKRHVPLPKRTGSRKDTGTSDAYPTPDDDQSASSREYDERASPMWQVYLTEAESHDKALIETWAKDMEGVVLFAGLFSASLTAFLVESYKQLQPDSGNQTETLSQQTVFLLTQIANQIGANGTGFITPAESTVLLDFSPKPSAVRINICWFLSLVLSFTAALFATIVQQWVRDYMQSSFQRYSSPLKRARIRQYLFEGASAHKMSVMVDLIPGLIHASLFLFFAGLCDFLFALNNTVAALTSACIAACVIVYMFTLVAPTINAQTPFQSPLSGAFWYIFQSVRRTEYCDKSTGNKKRLVSRNMAEGRVQLAMHDSEQRLERDARAIGWVVDSLTEDADLEPFVTGIPGSLSTKWGREVWAAVAKRADADRLPSADENAAEKMSLTSRSTSMSLGHLYDADAVADLSGRITRLLRTCIDPGILDAKVRRRRARACVDAALALVLNMRGKWQWFAAEADVMAQTLRYLAEDPGSSVAAAPTTAVAVMDTRKTWDPPPPLADPNFRSRWMCMSVMTVHALLRDDHIRDAAGDVVKAMAEAAGNSKLNEDAAATQTAALLDKLVKKAWYGARKLRETLERDDAESTPPQRLYDDAREWIRTLDYHWNVLGWAGTIDDALVRFTDDIADTTEHIIAHMPGAQLRLEGLDVPLMPHFVRPRHLAQRLAQTSWRLHELHANNWAGAPPRLADLCAPELRDPVLARQMSAVAAGRDGFARPFREQLWRLQDLAAGGMLYVLELLLAAARVDGNVRSADTREHYVGTFTAVTARWRDLRSSNAVRNGVGVLLREVLLLPGKEPPTVVPPPPVPPYLVEEMLKLVANVFKGTSGPEVDVVVGMVERYAEGLVKGDSVRKTAEEVAAKLMPKKSGRTHEEAQSL